MTQPADYGGQHGVAYQVDQEQRQRAIGFARLVDAFVQRESTRREPESPSHELTWSSSTLLAALLEQAVFIKQPLTKDEATQLIAPGRLEHLVTRQLVRFVLGRVELVGPRVARQLDTGDQADLARLRVAAYETNRRELWISAESARALHARHLSSNTATPQWGEVAHPSALEPRQLSGVDGFVLRVARRDGGAGNWAWWGASAAGARMWESLTRTASDQTALLRWLHLLDAAEVTVEAAAHMPHDLRERLLDAAMSLLETDENLGDLAVEIDRLGEEVDASRMTVARTCASLDMFWDDVLGEAYDETRSGLGVLVGLIVRYDAPERAPWHSPSRVIRIAELGLRRPYLLFCLALDFRDRPAPLAWLLVHPTTAAFAFLVIGELPLQEATMMGEPELRHARTHARRLALIGEALPMFTRALALADARADARAEVAPAVLDTMRGLARRCATTPFDTQQKRALILQAEAVFSLATCAILEARTVQGHTVPGGSRNGYGSLLSGHVEPLALTAPDHFGDREVTERIRVDLELLRFLREHRAEFVGRPDGFVAGLETTLVERTIAQYQRALGTDDDAASFGHLTRDPALVGLPWEHLACTAYERRILGQWIDLPALRVRVLAASTADERAVNTVLSGYAMRLRVHVEVLLHAHSGNAAHVLASRDIRDGVRDALEKAVEELITATTDATKGVVSLLDEGLALSIWGDEFSRLVQNIATGVERFAPVTRDRLVTAWIRKTDDPTVLLAIEATASSLPIRALATERLAQPGVLDHASDGHVVRVLELVQLAAAAGHHALVERLLARGDRLTSAHRLRTNWEERAFVARLLVLLAQKDRAAIVALPLPPTAIGDTPVAREVQGKFERSREFYLALADIEVDPERAKRSFAAQLARDGSSSALLTNLFAATLQLAGRLTDVPARRAAFARALQWWDGARRAVGAQQVDDAGIANEFLALDGAELDDEFDRRWSALGEPARARVTLLGRRIRNLHRRGMVDDAARLIAVTKSQHGGAVVAEMEVAELEPATVQVVRRTQDEYQQIWSNMRVLPAAEMSVVLGHHGLQDYHLGVHVNACEQVLRYFPVILALHQENRVNEMVVAFVGMQLLVHDWAAREQSPGGLADTDHAARDGTPGIRDWVIVQSAQEVAVCEAMRLRSVERDKIREHVTKLVRRYNPTGAQTSFMLVYFEGDGMDEFARKYREEVGRMAFDGELLTVGEWHPLGKNNLRAFRASLRSRDGVVFQDHVLIRLQRPAAQHGAELPAASEPAQG